MRPDSQANDRKGLTLLARAKRQSFLHGALILSGAAVLVKLIGALFKIPLQHPLLAGMTGYGYFATAYEVYLPVYTVAVAGLPVAVSRLVAEAVTLHRFADVQVIYRMARRIFLVTGTLGLAVMLAAAFFYPAYVGMPGSFLSMLVMAPSVFFCCMAAVNRGLYEGLRNMVPTACSQVLEALGKLLLGLGLAVAAMWWGQRCYAQGEPVFGAVAASAAHARELSLPYMAAGAMAGVTLGSFASMLYLMLRYARRGSELTAQELAASPPPVTGRRALRALLVMAFPVALAALATQLTNLIDVASLQRCLKLVLERHGGEVEQMYAAQLAADGTRDVLAWLVGSRSTAMTYVNLVPTITLTFGISALPVITSAWAMQNRQQLKATVESVLRITLLVALPAGIGLSVLAEPLMFLVYGQKHVSEIVGPMLQVLGIATIFVCLTAPVNSIFQAVGRADIPAKIIVLGGVVKLILNVVLVTRPEWNVMGSVYSTAACYAVMVIAGLLTLHRLLQLRLPVWKTVGKPLIAALLCGAAAWASNGLLARAISPRLATVLAVGLAGIVYGICLLVLKILTKDDIFMLPKGEKIAKILEKHDWIG